MSNASVTGYGPYGTWTFERRLNAEVKFKAKMVARFGKGAFTFNRLNYQGHAHKVVVTCTTHGDLYTTPKSLLRLDRIEKGSYGGCLKCRQAGATRGYAQKDQVVIQETPPTRQAVVDNMENHIMPAIQQYQATNAAAPYMHVDMQGCCVVATDDTQLPEAQVVYLRYGSHDLGLRYVIDVSTPYGTAWAPVCRYDEIHVMSRAEFDTEQEARAAVTKLTDKISQDGVLQFTFDVLGGRPLEDVFAILDTKRDGDDYVFNKQLLLEGKAQAALEFLEHDFRVPIETPPFKRRRTRKAPTPE